MKRRAATAIVGISLVALGLGACSSSSGGGTSSPTGSSSSGNTKPFVFGQAIAETGFLAAFDGPVDTGLKLWADKINASGGLGGRHITFRTVDTKSDINQGQPAATEVLSQGDVDVLIVSCDLDFGGPAASVAQKQGVLAISLCAGAKEFGPLGIGDLAFSMGAPAAGYGAGAAEWAMSKQGWKNAFVLEDASLTFYKEEKAAFVDRFKAVGGTVVGEATYQQSDASIGAQITKMRSASPAPDFIYLSSYGAGLTSAMRQIRAAGITTPIVGDGGLDGEGWKKAVPNASDVYFNTYASIYGDDTRPAVNDFFAQYRRSTTTEPANSYPILGWQLGEAVAIAVDHAGGSTDGAKLSAELQKFSDVPTIAGPLTFTPDIHLNYKRPLTVMKVQDGKTTQVTIWAPQSVPGFG